MKRILPLMLLGILTFACGRKLECEKPEEVVKTFYASVAFGDTETAYKLMTGENRRSLTERAVAASKTTGKTLQGPDMIVPGLLHLKGELAGARFEPVKVEVGDVKEVLIEFADGTEVRVPVTREAGCYRVPLDL